MTPKLNPAARVRAACLAVSLLALLTGCATSASREPVGSPFRCNQSGDIEERRACDGR